MIQIKRALISVSDKSGIVEFVQFLNQNGVEIISTGGTLKLLKDNGIAAIAIDDYTGFPEILDGRVKTLHPKVHGGLLGVISNPAHKQKMEELKIPKIDLVVVNLYPFLKTVSKPEVQLEEAIENIDIGGPSMIRSAAKNYKHTLVLTDPNDYKEVQNLISSDGISEEVSAGYMRKAFSHTAMYDTAISSWFHKRSGEVFPDVLNLSFIKKQKLRYGENPHQAAAFYEPLFVKSDFSPLQGKELSFNNMLDFDAAFHISSLLPENTVCIIKHLNPCGIAYADDPLEAFQLARRTDPISAFGGVIGIKGQVNGELATLITENFVEGVIAQKFTPEALELFSKKPNIRLIEIQDFKEALDELDLRPIHHGLLIQDRDYTTITEKDLKVVTKKQPSPDDIRGLMFAWSCVRFIKSNAIVYTEENATLGIGAGQMSRVDSVQLGANKALNVGLSVVGSYVASDAFFPFRDGIDALAKAGAKAIIQPGGSVRDAEVIQAADEHGLIMVFTGMRHFRH
ncbi:bifunctional phosphoribosylaminoimidazolecarboxamide formyltransferase/IMP cyclohydrolase [Leptospira noguchii]|uniref:bifunctional phosphoribosylaminoimidazolecarboxamide formyltransferase/IMP cyclohydrolase n=1 Tax=Leptospira noguchii TaxID=28182 RepID=UPI001F060A19|nr:bifunctional phosphoribosylaminoimidazolecarboxamide formyltransferase/IMP cyclohydrolase [Leptospira noguchii]MCH1910978.1 bifunctional phosphoribosylaminoimidazolecarboxamide formyltransferase/IMP cyclohydrolase [Leptospira noguchii]MCH1916870.1 bifunctional phosphoribosylaminoimidazolecarboxamide formyltransferase/IMP cyclohydrolase [Leptospira noguchii]UOG62658.1 bifunctional phosphoribosylaminoimidazolecarboxamide formyltransferase/IMP cyclohydrolase [Leptospira noguchii]